MSQEPSIPVPPPPPQPTPAEPPSRIAGLSCPRCAGALDLEVGLVVAQCPFCSTPLLLCGSSRVRRFAVAPRHDREEAQETVRRWFSAGWNKDPKLAREARFGEAFLCFLPFFRVQADVVGYALGTEERTRTVGSGKHRRVERYEVDVERPVEKHFDHTFPAVNVAEWGVQKVNLQGDRLESFNPEELERRGMVFAPTGSEMETRRRALDDFRRRADPRQGLKRVRFFFLETLRERCSLIYYPLWILRYQLSERSYQVLVDAEDGQVAYGKAPGNDLYRALCLVGSQVLAALLVTTTLQWSLLEREEIWPTAGAIVLGLGILRWGWKRFRWGAEVEEGTGIESRSGLDLAAVPEPIRRLLPAGFPGRPR